MRFLDESFDDQDRPRFATAISADGSTVAGWTEGGFPFLWTESEGSRLLGTYNGLLSFPEAISGDGSRVASWDGGEGTLWSEASGWQTLRALTDRSWLINPTDLSFDGSVVVGWRVDPARDDYAFRWTAEGGMVDIAGVGTRARGISADGTTILIESVNHRVVGTPSTGWGLWDAERGARFFDFPAEVPIVRVETLSADGSTIVGISAAGVGYRWTEDIGPEPLGAVPDYPVTEALDVSADGSVIVGRSKTPLDSRAFIWRAGSGIQPLDVLLMTLGIDFGGWTLFGATSVSADGTRIVGYGRSPSGRVAPFIAVIPEPGTALLVGLGLALLGARHRA